MNPQILAALLPPITCPLSGEIMRDPVILCANGLSYERTEIERWIEENGTNPETGEPLTDRRIVPNPALNHLIVHMRRDENVAPGGPVTQ